jgi:ergothioneine biosynthesis protein EgtB
MISDAVLSGHPSNPSTESLEAPARRLNLIAQYRSIRDTTIRLTAPLEIEDFVVQSMPDVSPTKWHLAHTSWFFETFVLKPLEHSYRSPSSIYDFLFNSYYNLIGDRWSRPQRGILTRPTVKEVFTYRAHVDAAMEHLLSRLTDAELISIEPTIILGLNHEQQHQELLLTDIKHVFGQNPLHPVYAAKPDRPNMVLTPSLRLPQVDWVSFDEGLFEIGHAGEEFAFDNEYPRHRTYVGDFKLAATLVSNRQFEEFIVEGGYERPELWLSDGWSLLQEQSWKAPLYWENVGGAWWHSSLGGFRVVDPDEPVTHVSYYEASAFAEWYGARLPSEEEWEIASNTVSLKGNFLESANFHPGPIPTKDTNAPALHQMFGDVWQWTGSAYLPYPNFKAPTGAIGEYNGKFMINQMVLRGGSCITPESHIRRTYRNFFPPSARWQFSGIRLAKGA